jgi:hypothetical protein
VYYSFDLRIYLKSKGRKESGVDASRTQDQKIKRICVRTCRGCFDAREIAGTSANRLRSRCVYRFNQERNSSIAAGLFDIQSILRHANISTTQGYYIFPNQEKAKAGLKKLTETVRKKYDVKA